MPEPSTLPLPLTALIGRDAEVERVAAHVRRGARLVTLTGPGGVGKTRVALAAAHALRATFDARGAGGAWFCELAAARDEAALCHALAATLGVPFAPESARAPAAQLGRALAARGRTLVVLDNLEQLVDHAAPAVTAWLAAAPEAQFVVTSRELLRVAGEQLVELAPLSLAAAAPGDGPSPAARLLIARVRDARPDWEPSSPEERRAVEQLAAALDGLPLALELAAARVRALGLSAVAAALESDRFRALAVGDRAAPDRHRTLRAALDWSWALLAPRERAAWAQCAVFEGGFSLATAAAVLDLRGVDEPPSAEASWPADAVQSLRDKSLLRAAPPSAERAGEPRFGMLVSVQQYALARLAETPGALDAARARQARALTAQLAPPPPFAAPPAHLAVERDNAAAVIAWALAGRDAPTLALGLEVALAFEPLARRCETGAARLSRYDAVLAHPAWSALPASLRARALAQRGAARRWLGQPAELFERDVHAAVELARAGDDPLARAEALTELARAHFTAGRADAGVAACDEALALYADAGEPPAQRGALRLASALHHQRGELEVAFALCQRALAAVPPDEPHEAGGTLASVGHYLQDLGRLDEAQSHYERALAAARAAGDPAGEGIARGYLGNLARRRGLFDDAVAHYTGAIAALRTVGYLHFEGVFTMDLAILCVDHARWAEAEARLSDALALVRAAGNRACEGLSLGHLGVALAETGRAEEAERAFAAAQLALPRSGPMAWAVAAQRGHLAVARARDAAARGDAAGVERALGEARGLLADAPGGGGAASAARGAAGDHVDIARRVLRRAIERAAPPGRALVLARDGAWFRAPGAAPDARVAVPGRGPLRKLLVALAGAHAAEAGAGPGRGLSPEELFRAGWPGERIARAAARNRVRVAIATLRGLGLRALLEQDGGAYRLAPGVEVVVLGDEPPGAGRGGERRPARD